jgi:hypothetical protein
VGNRGLGHKRLYNMDRMGIIVAQVGPNSTLHLQRTHALVPSAGAFTSAPRSLPAAGPAGLSRGYAGCGGAGGTAPAAMAWRNW